MFKNCSASNLKSPALVMMANAVIAKEKSCLFLELLKINVKITYSDVYECASYCVNVDNISASQQCSD